MADRTLQAIWNQGVETWNQWRLREPEVSVDLTDANFKGLALAGIDLRGASLGRVDLSEANLRGAKLEGCILNWADLREADMRDANLSGSDLREAQLRGANLNESNLERVDLSKVDLSEVNLGGANLRSANLLGAQLRNANLRDADLRDAMLKYADLLVARMQGANLEGADLGSVNLSRAYLDGANLTGADLRSARLQGTTLTDAVLTGVRLWETQRGGWSVKGVVCERAYWDEEGVEATEYAEGEFERLHRMQARVELVYPGGISAFEVNTLPALLQHLAREHPEAGIRLKSIEETGGGVKVSIHVDEADAGMMDAIREEAKRTQMAQLALRDNEIARLRIEKQFMMQEMVPLMLAAGGQHVHFAGEAKNVVIAAPQSSVQANQSIGESAAVLELLRELMIHREELPREDAARLEEAASSVGREMEQPEPKTSVIAAGLGVVKEIAMKVVESATEKAVLDHWLPVAHQLTQYLTQLMH